jgi:dTDP-4-amino-4,6-dideoxygalactose transaminase
VYSQVDGQNMNEYLLNITTGLYDPLPLHQHEAWYNYGLPRYYLVELERYASQNLALPMFTEPMEDEVNYVIDSVKPFSPSLD